MRKTPRARQGKKAGPVELDVIAVRGAREHNLKNIDVDIPKKSLVVITGVSGSGKSSLAFDTIYAEGQRRYVESLSAYARQFLGQMDKPKYETIRGLSPTISIEQKSASKNPRSTVGTITEVYDYLRVMFARLGVQHCHHCHKPVGRGDAQSMVAQILALPPGTKVLLLAPVVENRKGEHRERFEQLRAMGYQRVRIDGVVHDLSDVQKLSKNKKHNIEVVIDRLVLKEGGDFKKRLTDSVETTLKEGGAQMIVHILGREDIRMSEKRSCCGFAFPDLQPPLFSFNSPGGMCSSCHGLGTLAMMDPEKVIKDHTLSIREGAIIPWQNYFLNPDESGWFWERLEAMTEQWGLDIDKPFGKLSKKVKDRLLFGKDSSLSYTYTGLEEDAFAQDFEGLLPGMMRRYMNTPSERMKSYYHKFLSTSACKACNGQRLKPEVLAVKIDGQSIMDVCRLTIGEAFQWINEFKLEKNQEAIATELLKEIRSRLSFLVNVGLDYLSLDRKGPTLSGGEAQRIRLASQIGSELTGVLYILDEPSIGLHQRDNHKLLATLRHLRDIGNSLLVVEHDQETIEAADHVIDMGPGAGHLGGQVVASGTPKALAKMKASPTGAYLSGRQTVGVAKEGLPRKIDKGTKRLVIEGASHHNLKNITVEIPLSVFNVVTGVSGAGKSTLINQILYPACARHLHDSDLEVGKHRAIRGLSEIDKIINIDQKAIGRTPRSNPATYTGVFAYIRDYFADSLEARERGYKKGRFSFNVKGGRCEACEGDGVIRVEMHFLADVFVPCEACGGRRFNQATLEVKVKGHSIADVLDLSVAEALELFKHHKKIQVILQTLMDVGLSYIKLGQSATTLSGGEAQRIKLARELAKRDTGRTLYILDEPTTGLHFSDINKLLEVLSRLVDQGNTVLVIEHNLDVIKSADWIIDIGPEGGHRGGKLVAAGPPSKVAKVKASHTGVFLKKLLS